MNSKGREFVWRGEAPFFSEVDVAGIYYFRKFIQKIKQKRLEDNRIGNRDMPKKDEFETKSEHQERVNRYLEKRKEDSFEIYREVEENIPKMMNTYLNQKKIEMVYDAELEVFTISLSSRLFDFDFEMSVPREFAKQFKQRAKKMIFYIQYKKKSYILTRAELTLPQKTFTTNLNFNISKEEKKIESFFLWVKKYKLESSFFEDYRNHKRVVLKDPWIEARERKKLYLHNLEMEIYEIGFFKECRNLEEITLTDNRFLLKTDILTRVLSFLLFGYITIYLPISTISTEDEILIFFIFSFMLPYLFTRLTIIISYPIWKPLEIFINYLRKIEAKHYIRKFRNSKNITIEYDEDSPFVKFFKAVDSLVYKRRLPFNFEKRSTKIRSSN